MDFMQILGQKEAIWNTISVFLSDGGPPNIAGPGKSFPPLDGPVNMLRFFVLMSLLSSEYLHYCFCVFHYIIFTGRCKRHFGLSGPGNTLCLLYIYVALVSVFLFLK